VAEPKTRQYRSPLRETQHEQTRGRILDAAVRQVAEEGFGELTIPLVAERAGVSLRTVYRHFATKEALLEQIGELRDRQIGVLGPPLSIEHLLAGTPGLFESFDANDDLVRASDASRAGREVHDTARRRRAAALSEIFEDVARDLTPVETRRLLASVQVLWNTRAWLTMHDTWGMDGKEAGAAAQWAMAALIEEARRMGAERRGDPGPGPTPPDEERES
jgi:AcrR family transcriptional regulator